MKKSFEILQEHLAKKQKRNAKFSLRLLAKKLEISPAFASKIFSGKKSFPWKRMREIAELLELDPYALRQLQRAVLREQELDAEAQENVLVDPDESRLLKKLPSERFARSGAFSLLEEWYYLPMLELVDCRGFKPEAEWIAQRLGLKKDVAAAAWNRLKAMEVVREEVNGRWQKQEDKIIFPASRADILIQKNHLDMLKRSAKELTERREQAHFDQRLMLGIRMTSNPASFLKAKKYLEEALLKAAEMMNEGEGESVYYLGCQTYPLTND